MIYKLLQKIDEITPNQPFNENTSRPIVEDILGENENYFGEHENGLLRVMVFFVVKKIISMVYLMMDN